ncbi:MAG: TlpA disulfide reductase family protein [Niabella sp.]
MKFLSFLTILVLPLCSLAQQLTLTGTISGLADDATVSLTDLQNPVAPLAETKSKAGAFRLSAKLDGASLLGLSVGDSIKTAVLLGNETVNVSGAVDQQPDDWKFTGSVIQNSFTDFQNIFVPKFSQLNQMVREMQYADGTLTGDKKLQNAIDDIQKSVDDFITKNPASPVSALAILSTISITDDIDVLEKRTNSLKPAALSNVFGGQLKKALVDARFNSVGSIALDFSQADTTGQQVSLSQFRGKYVLIDFWASWCGPCRKENHFLVKTFNRYKDKNFTVLGVSLDEDKEDWLRAIAKDELKWTQVSDLKGWENEVAMKYRITSIPRNLLVGPDGKIIAKDLRGDDLDAKLEEVLGK